MSPVRRSRLARCAVPAVLAVAAALAVPATPARAGAGSSGAADLLARTGGTATFGRQTGNGRLGFFGTSARHPARRPSDVPRTAAPAVAAAGWAAHYGSLFGVADPGHDLTLLRQSTAGPDHVVVLQQRVQGVPVVGGQLVVTLDAQNQLISLNGAALPLVTLPTQTRLGAADAARIAVRKVSRDVRGGQLVATPPVLSVLDLGLLGGPASGGASTAWATTVTSADSSTRHQVFIDATRGAVLLDVDQNDNAQSRVVCDAGHVADVDPTCPGSSVTQVGSDTLPPKAPADGGDRDAYNAFRFAGAVSDFYSTVLGRDGIDGKGGIIASTVHYCENPGCPSYQNAFWDGHQMVYGDGFSSALDVVGHELTHGVTERTSGLFSYYQSGAINESISDVMGELIQQVEGPALNAPGQTDVYDPTQAWRIGEKLPVPAIRSMVDPTSDRPADPDRMTSADYSADYPWQTGFDRGGVHANDGVNNKAAYLMAVGGTFNGQSLTGVSGVDGVEKAVKVANVYYQLESLLTPGSGYADLARLLPQSCNLVAARGATLPLPAGGSTQVTAADCAQVALAVRATEMGLSPKSPQAAAPAQAPVCTNGGAATVSRLDTFDTVDPMGAGYTRGSAGTDAAGLRSTGQWSWSRDPAVGAPLYASSGTGALFGDDADPQAADPTGATYDRQDSYARTTTPIAARVGTFVRFQHAWEFDYDGSMGAIENYDGGRVEYTVDGGAHWYDAGSASPLSSRALLVNGGYNGSITNTDGYGPGYVDPNPLKGARGFVGSSHGWTSSRLDLSALSGKPVLLRWRIGADDVVGSLGWYVDDVSVYSCNPTALTLTAPTSIAYGGTAALTAHLVRAGSTAVLVGQPVQLWQRKHGTTSWTNLGTRRTSSAGNAVWASRPTTNGDYQVRSVAVAPLAASNAVVRTVGVRMTVSRAASATTFRLGHTFTTSGTVAPNHARRTVALQRYYSGAWHTVAGGTLGSTSRYAVGYRPGVRGTLSFRVHVAADADHAAGDSASFTVRVS